MTKKNELTLRVSKIDILSCGIRPLPEKHKGLRDKETRYRRRYVDLIVNPEVRQTFITRSKLITSIRRTLDEKDYIEVETPILSSIAGGAAARPFKTFHNTLKMDFFPAYCDRTTSQETSCRGIREGLRNWTNLSK